MNAHQLFAHLTIIPANAADFGHPAAAERFCACVADRMPEGVSLLPGPSHNDTRWLVCAVDRSGRKLGFWRDLV